MADHEETSEQEDPGSRGLPDEEERARSASKIIRLCSAGAAAAAVQPVPMVDVALLTPIQISMVRTIGETYGYTIDRKTALGIVAAFGLSWASQLAVLTFAKLVPFAGLLVAASTAYALTWAVGETSRVYFKSGGAMSRDGLKRTFKRVYEEKRRTARAAAERDHELGQELRQLTKAFRASEISEQEFTRRKEEIFARL